MTDLGAGADGSIWGIGCNGRGVDFGVWRWNYQTNAWFPSNGYAVKVCVLSENTLCHVNGY